MQHCSNDLFLSYSTSFSLPKRSYRLIASEKPSVLILAVGSNTLGISCCQFWLVLQRFRSEYSTHLNSNPVSWKTCDCWIWAGREHCWWYQWDQNACIQNSWQCFPKTQNQPKSNHRSWSISQIPFPSRLARPCSCKCIHNLTPKPRNICEFILICPWNALSNHHPHTSLFRFYQV